MKKLLVLTLALLVLTCAVALAEGDTVYGTMRIPYDQFYAAEGVSIPVDAVSSATNSKWKNEGLVAGTYYAEHADDDGGDILGVIYPVAVSQGDLDALGEEYAFEALEEVPAAYKQVTLENGQVSFSAVQGETASFEAETSLTTESRYGDYQISVKSINNAEGTSDIGTIYGVLLNTEEGVYALRHLENIWRDDLSFTAGFKTVEGHGNALALENYAEMMGKTITSITYITDTGYHTLSTDLYVPVKFDGGAEVAGAPAADGQTTLTLTNLPEDYAPAYAVKGLGIAVDDGKMTFDSALPGSYTLTVSDEGHVYADLLASFVLTTDILPVAFDAESNALIPAEDADEALAAAFIANISKVEVGENAYNATGKGAVAIFDADGAVDLEAAVTSGRGAEAVTTPVFAEAGSYEITVTSVGFDQTISFTLEVAE